MAEDQEAASKEFDPTPARIQSARKKGDVPKSSELNVAAAYAGLLIAVLAVGNEIAEIFGLVLHILFEQSDELAKRAFDGGSAIVSGDIIRALFWPLAPLFGVPALLVVTSVFAQRSFTFAPSKIAFKLSRISPLQNAKNKYGPSGLFEFIKNTGKLAIFSALLGWFLFSNLERILPSAALDLWVTFEVLLQLSLEFFWIVFVIAAVIGGVDYFWQSAEFIRRNRMTRKEVQDEQKENEGDPHLKNQRRQRAHEIAMNKMLSDVPDADVVIVNPTHFAIALKWDRLLNGAPICVAKGVDQTAMRIRGIAIESSGPIHSDPPTARALYATVDVGQEIAPAHYRAVAAAIRFAERISKRQTKWMQRN